MFNDEYKLNDLDDYCLLQIINFLDLKSKLKLYITCKRFNWLVSGWLAHQRAFGDLRHSQIALCTNERHKITDYQHSLKSITENCSKNDWNFNIMMLSKLFQLSPNIECLHFNCLDDENSVNEKLIVTILGALPKVTCLSFGIGLQMSSKSWYSIVNQLGKQLQHLQINRVNYLTLEHIVKRCPNLISLYIRSCPGAVGCVSYLWPKLRRLRLQSIATLYLRNANFTNLNRSINLLENEDDEETIDLTMFDLNSNNLRLDPNQLNNNSNENQINFGLNSIHINNANSLSSRAERHLNELNKTWYLNLVELRLNRITVKSLTVIFNHCINLQVLDLVLFFNRASLVFENQDFIQLVYRLISMRLFILDVHSKWDLIHLDKGLALMFSEWSRIEMIIIKRGLITEDLFERIKNNCKNLKVICVEFCDYIPYNHRLNEITDRVVDSLIEFTKLVKLRLHFTGITDDTVIKLIERCGDLKYLDLFGCVKVTEKSVQAISDMLNKANRCAALSMKSTDDNQSSSEKAVTKQKNGKGQTKRSKKFKFNLRKKTKSIKSVDCYSQSNCSVPNDGSTEWNLMCCKQFDTVTANCLACDKKPQTFYLSINRTKFNPKKIDFKPPSTLFIIGENNEIWNNYNYY